MARSIFIPMTVGGGIRNISDVSALMDVGADKVTVNTAFVENPKLIDEFARKFGSSTIIASIQAKRNIDGTVTCYTHNGRNNSKLDVYEWAHEVVERGVGEVLVTSVDRDGTGKGYDIGLISKLTKQLSVPVIACGGAGRIEDVFEASKTCRCCLLWLDITLWFGWQP